MSRSWYVFGNRRKKRAAPDWSIVIGPEVVSQLKHSLCALSISLAIVVSNMADQVFSAEFEEKSICFRPFEHKSIVYYTPLTSVYLYTGLIIIDIILLGK